MVVKLLTNFLVLCVIANKYKWYAFAKYYFLIKMIWIIN